MKANIHSDIGSVVIIRKRATVDSDIVNRAHVGSVVDVLKKGEEWSDIKVDGKRGCVKNIFLIFDEMIEKDG